MEQIPRHARIKDAVESATTTALHVQEFAHNAKYFYDQANHAHQSIPYAPEGRTFLGTIIPLIKKTIYYTVYGIILSTTSMAMYAIFYCLVMPEHYATEPIFFDYNYKSCGSAICPPTALIDLVSLNTQWKAHVPDVIHFSEGKYGQQVCHHEGLGSDDIDIDAAECKMNHQSANRILQPKQTYFIQVALTLPESSKNRDIGMFMIESVLKSKVQKVTNRNSFDAEANLIENGESHVQEQEQELKTLATSSRPAMLPYQSTYVSSVRKSFIMIPLILEAVPEARTVVIECFDHFRESTEYPMNYVEIRLVIPRNSYGINHSGMGNGNGNGNEFLENVQVWKAELRIGKELNHIQRLMKEWFYTSACLGILFFVCLQIIMWAWFKLWMHGFLKFVQETVNEQIRQSDLRNGNGNEMHDYGGADDFSDGISYLDFSAGGASASGSGASVLLGPRGSHVSVNASYFDQDDSSQWEGTSIRNSDESDSAEGRKCAASMNDGTSERTSKKNQHAQVPDTSNNRDSSDPRMENSRSTNAGAVGNSGSGSSGKNKKKRKKKKKKLSSNKSEVRTKQAQQAPPTQTTTEEERIMAERVMKGDFQRYEVFTGE